MLAVTFGGFVAGIVVGVFLGLLLSPVLRTWLAWQERAEAAREAEVVDDLIELMEREVRTPSEVQAPPEDPGRRAAAP